MASSRSAVTPAPDSLSEAPAWYGEKHALMAAYTYRNPYDQALTNLIGELSTRSVEFRTRWAAHDVRQHRTGTKRLHHPG